jgi:prepilin-type N-terminal cleavage/methylation domain-containing protein
MKKMSVHRPGFTMIEVLLALVILSLCVIPVFDSLGRTMRQARFSRDSVLAMQLAVEVVDQVCSMPFQAVPLAGGHVLDSGADGSRLIEGRVDSLLVLSPLPEGFARVLAVRQVSPRLKRVECTVSWAGSVPGRSTWQALTEWAP